MLRLEVLTGYNLLKLPPNDVWSVRAAYLIATIEVEFEHKHNQEVVLRLCCIFVVTRLFPSNRSGPVSFLTSFCFIASLTGRKPTLCLPALQLIKGNLWSTYPARQLAYCKRLTHNHNMQSVSMRISDSKHRVWPIGMADKECTNF